MTDASNDDVNLYEYWKVFKGKKWLFWGTVIIFLLITAVVNFSQPKIYKGEVIVKMATPEFLEVLESIAYLDERKFNVVFPGSFNDVSEVRVSPDSVFQRAKIVIEMKDTGSFHLITTDLIQYINNYAVYKKAVEQKRAMLTKEISEVSDAIKRSEELFKSIRDKEGAKSNLVELTNSMLDLKVRKERVEQLLGNLNTEITGTYILPYPVKPTVSRNLSLMGVIGFFAGIFLVFISDAIQKFRTPPVKG